MFQIDEDFDRLYNITTDDPIDKWNRSLAGLTVRLCQQYKDGASNKLVDLLRNGASTGKIKQLPAVVISQLSKHCVGVGIH